MRFPSCKCGGKAKYVDNGPMVNQYECNKCGWKTGVYFDGREYAVYEWNIRHKVWAQKGV